MHRLGQLRAHALMIAAARGRTSPRPDKTLTAPGIPGAAVLSALKAGQLTCPALVEATGPTGRLIVNALRSGNSP